MIYSLFETKRFLTQMEKDLANRVFKNSISFDNVLIGNMTGLGGVPWTQYYYYDEIVGDQFTLHMGVAAFSDCTSSAPISSGFNSPIRDTFIHELAHVWQGQHSRYHGSYQFRAAWSQMMAVVTFQGRNAAYEYKAGKSWDSYNVEQQAKIVEDWFSGGLSESSELFVYIKENIRK